MTENKPKRHHYLTEFELSYFKDNNCVWVYDRNSDNIRPQTIKDTTVISDFYTFKTLKGEKNTSLERALAVGDDIASRILRKIHNGNWRLSNVEHWEFAAWLALKWTRTPTHQKKVEAIQEAVIKSEMKSLANDKNKFNQIIDTLETDLKINLPNKEEQRKFMMDGSRWFVEIPRLAGQRAMVVGLKETYEEIYRMRWVFRYATKGKAFLTSDNSFFIKPFFDTNNPLGFGLRSNHTVAFAMLTPKVCLSLMQTDSPNICAGKLSGNLVNDLNNYVALFSRRFVISHSKELLHNVINRTKLASIKPYKAIVEFATKPDNFIKVVKD